MERKTIIHFCKRNVWTLLSGLFCLGALIFFLDQRYSHPNKTTTKDYIAPKTLFDRIYARECLSKECLESGCDLLNKHPELASQYQGILSLALAQSGFTGASKTHTQLQLKRVDPVFSACTSTWHKEFATTGFLIAEGQYDIALQKALALEENLQKEASCPRLRTFNLLRIAFLAHETKHEEISKKAVDAVQTSALYPEIQPLFSEETFTLNDFFH